MPDFPFPQLDLPPPAQAPFFDDACWYIRCAVRKKSLVLTPEEWVRQHVVALFTAQGYSTNLMKLEQAHQQHRRAGRSDVVVYNRQQQPLLIAECKAPEVKIDKDVLGQALRYNQSLRAEWLFLSNGSKHLLGQPVPKQQLPKWN